MSAATPLRRPAALQQPAAMPAGYPSPRKPITAHRPRLVLVTQRRTTAGRLPFLIVVGAVLVMGLIAVLLLHMIAAQDGFRATALSQRLSTLTNQEQTMQRQVEADSAPSSLQAKAAALGMVPSSVGAYRRLSDGRAVGTQNPVYVAPPAPLVTKPVKTAKTAKTGKSAKTTATTPTTTGKPGTATAPGTTATTTSGTTSTSGKTGTGKSGTPKPPKRHAHSPVAP